MRTRVKFAMSTDCAYKRGMKKRLFVVNSAASPRSFVRCTSEVKRDAVRREVADGVEHIVVSSYTLPDNVVMNGGLYPAEEIEAGYKSLERTLAPVEHPTDSEGAYISATDPSAIHNFYAGAFNQNVKREGGRVHVEKWINVSEAKKTERGRRLLDRIHELETNEKARPIHTSVGVYLTAERLEKPVTNAAGATYDWVAREMVFDHDAILLDSVGAAQPGQGVGMAVNRAGDQLDSTEVFLNNVDQSLDEKETEVHDALRRAAIGFDWIEKQYDDRVVFRAGDNYFEVPYVTDADGRATIAGVPLPVERKVAYTPKTNALNTGDAMFKEFILNALAEAKVPTEGLSDEQLMAEYKKLTPNNDNGNSANDQTAELAGVVANALKPLSDRLASMETRLNADATAEVTRLAEIVGNSDAYPALDTETAKLLPAEKLREMAANCAGSNGLPLSVNHDYSGSAGGYKATELPD